MYFKQSDFEACSHSENEDNQTADDITRHAKTTQHPGDSPDRNETIENTESQEISKNDTELKTDLDSISVHSFGQGYDEFVTPLESHADPDIGQSEATGNHVVQAWGEPEQQEDLKVENEQISNIKPDQVKNTDVKNNSGQGAISESTDKKKEKKNKKKKKRRRENETEVNTDPV